MPNRLAAETSPYLRQHADNPVDWWPWGEAALALARSEQKPILLSIGYSACHWCHVMAHESFEDAATAAVMNELYVCIKVDREERPDLDRIYQLAHQALARRAGGWPLTVFLAPDDHLPFYAGTYFPRDPRYGMPPFVHVLQQVRAWWDTRREDVRAQNAALKEFLDDYERSPGAAQLSAAPLQRALEQIAAGFDRTHGGRAGAPKFPHGAEMALLLDLGSTEAVDFTLAHIADGGIHDQIGGGFARYSVDERWEIPHFEKMLYDNAQLLPLLAQRGAAALPGPDAPDSSAGARLAAAARDTVAWLERELRAPNGAFYAALDADSEGEEGKFYVWQRDDVQALLDADEYAVAAPHWGFDRAPNFEQHAWNPLVAQPLEAIATTLGIAHDDAQRRLQSARQKLLLARASRVRPGLDDKILTAWNALLASGLAQAARSLGEPRWAVLARAALDALQREAWHNGRLCAKAGADALRFPAYLDDHAYLLDALLEQLQCAWDSALLTWAGVLADALLARFEDDAHGGFFFTAHDHETLIQRPKPWADDATPSGNGVAARALLRLGHLIGETRYGAAAERALRAGFATLEQMPQAACGALRALNDLFDPRTHVVLRAADGAEADAWCAALTLAPGARVDVYVVPPHAADLPGTLAAQTYAAGGVAYVCKGTQCLAPIATPQELAEALG